MEWVKTSSWVKGTRLSDGSVRFPSGQYMGMNGNYPVFYFAAKTDGSSLKEKESFVLEYDPSTGSYFNALDECVVFDKDFGTDNTIEKYKLVPMEINEGKPAAATQATYDEDFGILTFKIDPVTVDNLPLDTELMSFRVYRNGEPHSFSIGYENFIDVPYTFAQFNYSEEYPISFWGLDPDTGMTNVTFTPEEKVDNLAIEVMYNILDRHYVSDRSTLEVSGVKEISDENAMEAVRWYSIDGRSLLRPVTGINIAVYPDGTTRKIMVK